MKCESGWAGGRGHGGRLPRALLCSLPRAVCLCAHRTCLTPGDELWRFNSGSSSQECGGVSQRGPLLPWEEVRSEPAAVPDL